jgi:hypothetical protein
MYSSMSGVPPMPLTRAMTRLPRAKGRSSKIVAASRSVMASALKRHAFAPGSP